MPILWPAEPEQDISKSHPLRDTHILIKSLLSTAKTAGVSMHNFILFSKPPGKIDRPPYDLIFCYDLLLQLEGIKRDRMRGRISNMQASCL